MISLCSRTIKRLPETSILQDSVSIQIVNDIELVKTIWSQRIPECHPLDYARLLSIQNSMYEQFRFYYGIVKNMNGEIVCLHYFQLLPFRSEYFDSFFKRYKILSLIERALLNHRFRLLFCGSLFSVNAPGYFFTDNRLSVKERFDILQRSAAQILKTLPKCEMIFKDVDSEFQTFFIENRYTSFDDDVTMTMHLDPSWNSIEDYVSSLKHKYAQRVRKVIRAASSIERHELSLGEIITHAEDINRLFHQVVNKQRIRLGIPDSRYFIEMKRNKPLTFSMCGYFIDKQMVGFASYLVNHKNDELHYIGMDYKFNRMYQLYYNILIDGIAKAIDNKIQILELGRTAREAKSVMGASPIVFQSYIRFRNHLSYRIYKELKAQFKRATNHEYKDRHPFKHQPKV